MKSRLLILLPSLFWLSACSAWPTIIYNQSAHPISFQYHHKNYSEWSALFSLEAGSTTRLAREHWVQDIVGFRITEGDSAYPITRADLEEVRRACKTDLPSRRFNLARDCYVTYHGGGRLTASSAKPEQLVSRDTRHDS